jgi:UDP-N-acetylmuramoyl-tripeptide--D-alanyl-D-alanine ligase
MKGAFRFDSVDVCGALELSAPEPARVRRYTGASTDSRTVRPGDLFVALTGERVDGADFVPQAAAAGALGAIVPVDRALPDLGIELFAVSDPLAALAALASDQRRRTAARVIGITGSSGKTTVREMVACALFGARSVYRTPGNLNSQVGLPLSILNAPLEPQVWVLELGASEPGEIARLTAIASPDDAVITTVGPAHLEWFGDVETVLHEKLSLVAGAAPNGVVVVGERPARLGEAARRMRPDTLIAGVDETANYRPEDYAVEAERVWFERRGVRFKVSAGGIHHLRDALLAAALADALGVDPEVIARGLGEFRPLPMRGVVEHIDGLTVVADCYNANPESFAAAIEHCRTTFGGRKLVAVVGTMRELGAASEAAHREVAERLFRAGFELVAATGEFKSVAERLGSERNGTRVVAGRGPEEVWPPLVEALGGDEVVLVKASRGVRLERIVELLRDRFSSETSTTVREED